MNCLEIQELLAAYFDGELADDTRAAAETHLGQCPACARHLQEFEQISVMTRSVKTLSPPESLWAQIEQQLDQQPHDSRKPVAPGVVAAPARFSRWSSLAPRLAALAATVVVAVGLGSWAYHSWFGHSDQAQFAFEFGRYVDHFRRDPAAAQLAFLARYESHRVDARQAIRRVGYHPAVAAGLPEGYTLQSTHVVKMPCCTCVQAVCKRSDGSTLAIFEHDEEQAAQWFGDNPKTMVPCHDKQCCFVQLNDQVAVSWKRGSRHITMIGAQNVAEVREMVGWLDETSLAAPSLGPF